jgi:glycosyltransferase involved in cell wall biosynthesis
MEFICFGSGDQWGRAPTSRYHLLNRLSKKHKFLYVESIGIRRPKVLAKDLRKIFQKLTLFLKGVRVVNQNLWVVTPLIIPLPEVLALRKINNILLRLIISYYKFRMSMHNPIIWANIPSVEQIFCSYKSPLKIYYCPDRFSAFPFVQKKIVESMEKKIVEAADLVIGTSKSLVNYLETYNKPVIYLPHGVDYEHFAKALNYCQCPPQLLNIKGKIVLYFGRVDEWFDTAAVKNLAERNKTVNIVILGDIATDVSLIKKLSNVHFLGFIAYQRLPNFLHYADCCILPFQLNELVENVNPLKVYEYLAAGCPVVASPLPELLNHSEYVSVYHNADEFERLILIELEKGKGSRRSVISNSVRNQSWEEKAKEIERLIEDALLVNYCEIRKTV